MNVLFTNLSASDISLLNAAGVLYEYFGGGSGGGILSSFDFDLVAHAPIEILYGELEISYFFWGYLWLLNINN